MPLPQTNQPRPRIPGEVTQQNFQDIQDPRSIPGFGSISSIRPDSAIAQAVFRTQNAPDSLSLQLRRELEGIIGEGGVGLSPEQLDVQFRGVEQQLQPTFSAQIERIDEQAARRGVFRSGIPLAQAQKTQRQQAQQLGNIRSQMETENQRAKNRTLLTALSMLQALESDLANRELYLQALDELKKAQDQKAYFGLLGQFGTLALDAIFPGAGTAVRATTPSLGSSRPGGGF